MVKVRGLPDEKSAAIAVKKKILVTGCGRCGTKYFAAVLQSVGFQVTHERMGADGISSWYMATEAKRVPLGPPPANYTFDHTFHLVRHPLTAIPSISSLKDESWDYISQYVLMDASDSKLLKSAKYWYFWNELTERKAKRLVRVEDLTQIVDQIEQELGVVIDRSAVANVPRNVNSRKVRKIYHWIEEFLLRLGLPSRVALLGQVPVLRQARASSPEFTWESLQKIDPDLAGRIQKKAEQYGY